jgi:UDP-3-O-[3-hydroxymyristoyl] glucosamine N-acyltransferase
MRLDELAKALNAELAGDGAVDVRSVATLEDAGEGQVSFLSNRRYRDLLETTRASAVIVHPSFSSTRVALLKAMDPYFAFAKAVELLHGHRKHSFAGVHPRANVDPTAKIGENTTIYPGVFVGPRCRIGRDCILYANACIYDGTVIGDRVIIHSGAVIGVDGFGFATQKGVHHKIAQVGHVVIEDDVEIGGCTVIGRAALDTTVIGKGSKLDSLVAIGHGAKIGAHALLVAQTGIAGSVKIGHHLTTGGQVGIAGHLKIGDNVTIAAQSGVMEDVDDQTVVMGSPAMPATHARRVYTLFTQFPDIVDRIKQLEHGLEELADTGDTPLA